MKALGGRSGTEVIPLIVDSWRRICEERRPGFPPILSGESFRYNPVFLYQAEESA